MIKPIQSDPDKMSLVVTMFTDVANMYREQKYNEARPEESYSPEQTASMFVDLMTVVFGQQDLDRGAKILADSLIRRGRKPNFYITDKELREKADNLVLERIP